MDVSAVDQLTEDQAKGILKELFGRVCTPAFGVLPQRELDLTLFDALRKSGVVSTKASLYDLMTQLKVTRAKARNLLFEVQIRAAQSEASLDDMVKAAISRPGGFAAESKYLVLGIEDPVVQAHLKELAREVGHITDASFDATIVRITPSALGAVAERLLTEEERQAYDEALIDAGIRKPGGIKAVITGGLKHLLTKALGEEAKDASVELAQGLAEGYIEELTDYLAPKGQKALDRIKREVARLKSRLSGDETASAGKPGPRIR